MRLRSDTRAHEPDFLADDRADDRRADVGCVLPWVPERAWALLLSATYYLEYPSVTPGTP